jgi:hypothetical protein
MLKCVILSKINKFNGTIKPNLYLYDASSLKKKNSLNIYNVIQQNSKKSF